MQRHMTVSAIKLLHKKTWQKGLFCLCITIGLAYGLRMFELPCWQNPEYRLGNEMLLATHDAYHWLSGAVGFGRAVNHPMSLMLKGLAEITGISPANIAFWLPAIFASLVAGAVYAFCWAFGSMATGIAAGLITSLAPGFLARTLLGYYDTDLVTLLFPLVIALPLACWAMFEVLPDFTVFFYRIKKNVSAEQSSVIKKSAVPQLSCKWICLLCFSGLLSFWSQEWHSVFPYIIRYNTGLVFLLAIIAAKNKTSRLCTALCYAFPALCGVFSFFFIIPVLYACYNHKVQKILLSHIALLICWIIILFLALNGAIFETLANQINAYLKHTGDSHSSGGASLVFPSVAQSIIEVQDLPIMAVFPYFHPWLEAAFAGFIAFAYVIYRCPAALFLLPLGALGILSTKLGGRMVMFGAPVVAIGIAMPCYWIACRLLRKVSLGRQAGWLCCLTLCGFMVAPFISLIPELSQGPVINRRHAQALTQAQSITPEDSMLWLWWDWGYAAHYFARRNTIADGAQHGGPSLYLPASVFATDNPRFARQIIRNVSSLGNEPGNFFAGLNAAQAQELINRLRSVHTPLVHGKGRQFIITSFEMLKLGFWISNFGNWNFITKQGGGGALSIVPQELAYNLKTGEVKLENAENPIFPSSISVFQETGLILRNYVQEWFKEHPVSSPAEQQAWLAARRNINFMFNRITDEKLAMDATIYNSLMVQLLLANPNDPRLTPYFRLVYDNIFARIYEVLPMPEDKN